MTFEARVAFRDGCSIATAIGSLAGNVSRSASSSISSRWETADSDVPAVFSLLKVISFRTATPARNGATCAVKSQLLVYGRRGFICRILHGRLRISGGDQLPIGSESRSCVSVARRSWQLSVARAPQVILRPLTLRTGFSHSPSRNLGCHWHASRRPWTNFW
jgi:hypothetical protein